MICWRRYAQQSATYHGRHGIGLAGVALHEHALRRARIAHGKANAAIAMGMGTRALMNRAEQQAYFVQAINGLAGGDFVPVPGGVLITDCLLYTSPSPRD